jgi:hypothetical protein
MSIAARISGVVDRLVHKMEMSQTPVPGFIVGLSGTDSLVAFEVLSQGLKRMGMEDRLYGVHYFTEGKKPGAFSIEAMPWLRERYPKARLINAVPLGGNQDPQRWADLQLRALYDISICSNMEVCLEPHGEGRNYWVAGTINATEHALGKHSIGANAVSLQPIRSLWKSDVLEACVAIGVPKIIVDNAYLPDCLCGRDEIAAKHIELIDEILRYQIDVNKHDAELIMMLMQWVSDRKREGGFRSRIPYIV